MTKHFKDKLAVIYDMDCPMCNHFAGMLDSNNDQIELVNGRDNSRLLQEAGDKNLDIDQGLIVCQNNRFYHGQNAIHMLVSNLRKKGPAGLFTRTLMRFPVIIRILYPVLKFLRIVLLKLAGKSLINSAHRGEG
jgi:predicted DCC family thiol-disulfide oxidoreductase YuxK